MPERLLLLRSIDIIIFFFRFTAFRLPLYAAALSPFSRLLFFFFFFTPLSPYADIYAPAMPCAAAIYARDIQNKKSKWHAVLFHHI